VFDLFRRWQRYGTRHQIFTALLARADAKNLITWDLSVDSTIVRAHQHTAGARKGGLPKAPPDGSPSSPLTMGPAAAGPCREGVRLLHQPAPPAAARNLLHHPGQGRPGSQPQAARLSWRPFAEVRPGGLQGSARGRERHQSPQKALYVATRYDKLAVAMRQRFSSPLSTRGCDRLHHDAPA
jgi:hypothetical protein